MITKDEILDWLGTAEDKKVREYAMILTQYMTIEQVEAVDKKFKKKVTIEFNYLTTKPYSDKNDVEDLPDDDLDLGIMKPEELEELEEKPKKRGRPSKKKEDFDLDIEDMEY